MRQRTEEVINAIVGDERELYFDYDKNGTINDPGDGYGSLPNGDRLGYLQGTALHAKYAADAVDSTANIRLYSDNLQLCIQNMSDWTNQLLPLAQELDQTTCG